MGSCGFGKSYQQIFSQSYNHKATYMSRQDCLNLKSILNKPQFTKKNCILEYPFVYKINKNSTVSDGIIIFQQNEDPASVRAFFGQIIGDKMGKKGLVILNNHKNLIYKGLFTAIYSSNKVTISQIEGKYFNGDGKLIVQGKWRQNKLIYGQLHTQNDYSIKYDENKGYIISFKDSDYIGSGKINSQNKFIRQGIGMLTTHDKSYKYQGQWRDDKKNGHAKVSYKEGNQIHLYQGQFKDNERYGKGKYTTKQYLFQGQWGRPPYQFDGYVQNLNSDQKQRLKIKYNGERKQ